MSDANQQEIIDLLRTLLKVQSLSAVRDFKSKKEKIFFLSEAGLTVKEIANIVGTTNASVSQTIYDAKKKIAKDS